MFIEKIFYKHGTEVVGKACVIPDVRRDKYMSSEFIKLYGDDIFNIGNTGSTALIYAVGPASHGSDSRNCDYTEHTGNIVIKGQIGTKLFTLGKKFNNIDYMTINADTCASSLSAMHQAKHLLDTYDDVIIYSENLANDLELKFFEQLGIDIVCGDGISVVHLTKHKTSNSIAEVLDTSFVWNLERSPMTVSQEGYKKAISKIDTKGITHIKPHGTGTASNNSAEDDLIADMFKGVPVLSYKNKIGHTQGASTSIELGMFIEDVCTGFDVLVLASGLGGFYGACRIKSC